MCSSYSFGIKQYKPYPFIRIILMNTYSGIRFGCHLNSVPNWFLEFLKIFSTAPNNEETNTLVMQGVYVFSKDLKDKISAFIGRNIKEDSRICNLGKWMKLVQLGEKILFLPYSDETDILKMKGYLIEENIPSFKENKKFVKEYIEKISDNYQIDVFDDKNGNIGEPQKNKRCCLFCGKMEPEASFTQKAHAISESLGNKSIVQNEECDECNNFLGKTVEQDFANYMEFFRSMYKVYGKSGIPKNEKYYHSGDRFNIVVNGLAEGECDQTLIDTINLDSDKKITPQNLYKSIVLYAVSLIGNTNRESLKRTIRWLKSEENVSKLPPISYSVQPGLWRDRPWAICYSRKNEDKNFPQFVIEFHFLFFVYVAIVPLASGDDKDFTEEQDYNRFWNSMPHFKDSVGWVREDWSSNEQQELKYSLKMEKR